MTRKLIYFIAISRRFLFFFFLRPDRCKIDNTLCEIYAKFFSTPQCKISEIGCYFVPYVIPKHSYRSTPNGSQTDRQTHAQTNRPHKELFAKQICKTTLLDRTLQHQRSPIRTKSTNSEIKSTETDQKRMTKQELFNNNMSTSSVFDTYSVKNNH